MTKKKPKKETRTGAIGKTIDYVPRTAEERKLKWQKIFDDSTNWVEECVEARKSGGIGGAMSSVQTALAVIEKLEQISGDKSEGTVININFKPSEAKEKDDD